MFKLYSKGCQHALRALTYVIAKKGNTRFPAHEVCEQLQIPEYFTRKIFQSLVQGGFLNAHRGPGGGYSLARDASTISLLDIIQAVDGEGTFNNCILGLHECSNVHPCPLHDLWVDSKKGLIANLAKTTLDEFTAVSLKRMPFDDEGSPATAPATDTPLD